MKFYTVIIFLCFTSVFYSQSGTWSTVKSNFIKVFSDDETTKGKVLKELMEGDSVNITGITDDLKKYVISFNDKPATISVFYVNETPELKELKADAEKRLAVKIDSLKTVKLKLISNKYGKSTAKKIMDEKIWIGMTSEMCLLSWGEPEHKSKTVTAYGTNEFWHYGYQTLHFENDKLKGWTEDDY